ncbi:MAG TPA: 50S ribosomal protein L9 [Candidatus Omnitrophica bacterium]|nr:50S ribosomal protein L9 [Candidatus Omnitrophota bacterium]
MIKVILKEDVSGLGRSGEVKQVKDGFARNFLFPRKLALLACDNNLKRIEAEVKKKESQMAQERKKAEEVALRLAGLSVTLTVEVNEEGKLYGSLTQQDVARAVSSEGIEIDKKNVMLAEPIKELGIYDVDVKLHPEVVSKIKVWVVKK